MILGKDFENSFDKEFYLVKPEKTDDIDNKNKKKVPKLYFKVPLGIKKSIIMKELRGLDKYYKNQLILRNSLTNINQQ